MKSQNYPPKNDLTVTLTTADQFPTVDLSHQPVVDALTYWLIEKTKYLDKLGADGLKLFAEAAVATDAIVFPDDACELTIFPDGENQENEDSFDRLVIYHKYQYWKRLAYEQQGDCTVYSMRPLNTAEKKAQTTSYGRPIQPADLAYECVLVPLARSEYCMERWGISFGHYLEEMAPRGLGYVSAQEMENRKLPKNYTWQQVAEKRAEVAALKKILVIRPPAVTRYHLQFGFVRGHIPQLDLSDVTMTRPNELAMKEGQRVVGKVKKALADADANDVLF